MKGEVLQEVKVKRHVTTETAKLKNDLEQQLDTKFGLMITVEGENER